MDNRITCTIDLYREEQKIGNILIRLESTINILDYINQCIQNYNRNLTDPSIEDAVLAHRFFDIENLDCTQSKVHHQRILVNSFNYVKDNYKHRRWPSYSEQDGYYEIGITFEDKEINKKRAGSHINIHLKNSTIMETGIYDYVTPDDYMKRYKVSEDEFKRIPFLELTFFPGKHYFNQLEDLIDVVNASEHGFKCNESDLIFVPRK